MDEWLPLPPTLEALASRLGIVAADLEPPERERALAALEDATAVVLGEVGAPTARAWSAACPPAVRTVVLKAARREYENPEGYTNHSLGEFSATVAAASGAYLTRPERLIVQRIATPRRLGTIRTPSAYEQRP